MYRRATFPLSGNHEPNAPAETFTADVPSNDDRTTDHSFYLSLSGAIGTVSTCSIINGELTCSNGNDNSIRYTCDVEGGTCTGPVVPAPYIYSNGELDDCHLLTFKVLNPDGTPYYFDSYGCSVPLVSASLPT